MNRRRDIVIASCIAIGLFMLYVGSDFGVEQTHKPAILGNPEPQAVVLTFDSILEINDGIATGSLGDEDGIVDAGETVKILVGIRNSGDSDATNVIGNISSSDPLVNIGLSEQNYITIAHGTVGGPSSYFTVTINSSCPENHQITFTLNISSDQIPNGVEDTFTLAVIGAANPQFYYHSVTAESDGDRTADDDYVVDPGEVVQFDAYLRNTGGANLYNPTAKLWEVESVPDYMTVTGSDDTYSTLYDDISPEYGTFQISVTGACPAGTTLDFILNITDGQTNNWTIPFSIVVSGTPSYSLAGLNYIEIFGDGDGEIDAGESWYLEANVNNTGTAQGRNIDGYLVNASIIENFTFYKNQEQDRKVDIGNLEPGRNITKSSSYNWRFAIDNTALPGQVVSFTLKLNDSISSSRAEIPISFSVVGVPNYTITNLTLVEYSGNDDEKIDFGERWYVEVTVKNIGAANGRNLLGVVTANTGDIDWNYDKEDSRTETIGNIEVGEELTRSYSSDWRFEVAGRIRSGASFRITITLVDESGCTWTHTETFKVNNGYTFSLAPETIAFIVMGVILGSFVIGSVIVVRFKVRRKSSYRRRRAKSRKKKPTRVVTTTAAPKLDKLGTLLQEAKTHIHAGKTFLSKGSYDQAIEEWDKAIIAYEKAENKASEESQSARIRKNIEKVQENKAKAYVMQARGLRKDAYQSRKDHNFQKAKEGYSQALKVYQKTKNYIGAYPEIDFGIEDDQLKNEIGDIETRSRKLAIKEVYAHGDDLIEKAEKQMDDADLIGEAASRIQQALNDYARARAMIEQDAFYKPYYAKVQAKIVHGRKLQAKIQTKMDELLDLDVDIDISASAPRIRTPELFKRRKEILQKIVNKYAEIPVDELADYLEFEDTKDLKEWLVDLPDDFPLRISGNVVQISQSEDISADIDKLMNAFQEWEDQKFGKV